MGNFWEYLLVIIRSLLWPPKGVILFEEQVFQWCYATLKMYLINGGIPQIMIAFAIYAVIMFVVFEQGPRHHMHHVACRGIGNIIGFISRLIFVIFFGWIMLIYGTLFGGLRGEENENDPRATQNISIHRHWGRFVNITQSFTRLSWHFRFGRWIFRSVYNITDHINFITSRPRMHRTIARIIALFIIIYKAWEIPYLLTH